MGVNAIKILRGSFPLFFPSPPSPRDSVAVIAGVQRIDGPLQVKYWGRPDPCGIDAYAQTWFTVAKVSVHTIANS